YEDSARDYEEIRRRGSEMIHEALTGIATQLDSSGMSRPMAMFQNATVSAQGEVDWEDSAVPASLISGDEILPVQLVEQFQERKLVFPVPQTALGAVALGEFTDSPSATKFRLKSSPRKIENDEWAVRFDPHGNITSIQSLEDSAEFVEQGKLANIFQLLEDKPLFWSAWDIDVFAYETAQDLVKSESFE